MSPVLRNKNIPGPVAAPQAGSKLTLLNYDMLHIPNSRGEAPSFILTVWHGCVCLAAVQSTYINTSQHPSTSRGAGHATLEREAAMGKP